MGFTWDEVLSWYFSGILLRIIGSNIADKDLLAINDLHSALISLKENTEKPNGLRTTIISVHRPAPKVTLGMKSLDGERSLDLWSSKLLRTKAYF